MQWGVAQRTLTPPALRGRARRLTLDVTRTTLYPVIVIKSFRSKQTERLFNRERVREFQSIERAALRKLAMLEATKELLDLAAPPGNRLERLRGDREGQHSIRINDQWRVCFAWRDGDAYGAELTDYH